MDIIKSAPPTTLDILMESITSGDDQYQVPRKETKKRQPKEEEVTKEQLFLRYNIERSETIRKEFPQLYKALLNQLKKLKYRQDATNAYMAVKEASNEAGIPFEFELEYC